MVFAVLLFLVHSEFWEYNDVEFESKINNSVNRPIFAACIGEFCPHCRGVPEKMREFAKQEGPNSKYIFTVINCNKATGCSRLGIRSVPSFRLIRSPQSKYWTECRAREIQEWRRFLTDSGGQVMKVDDPDEGRDAEIVYHMAISDPNSEFLDEFREAAQTFAMYGGSFLYTLETIANPILTVISSNFCRQTFVVKSRGQIKTIIAKNKFGFFHEYDGFEYDSRDKTVPLALVVTENMPLMLHLHAFENFTEKYCGEVKFGWIRANENAIEATFNKSVRDAPYLAMINDRLGITIASKARIADADRKGLFDELLGKKSRKSSVSIVTCWSLVFYVSFVAVFYVVYNGVACTPSKDD